MEKAKEKTNVMRILDQKKVPYKHYCYADTAAVSGVEVASVLGQDLKAAKTNPAVELKKE